MDPDDNLNEQLELARKIERAEEPIDEDEVDRLADLVLELHRWIASGGCVPSAWEQ